jgi:ABC-type branched-subunit amino acid transport system ATPase component|tara:strand:- start:537 stop:728 length:192 start_codon:yes stop_codon:yes gene_type:complete
MSQLTISELDEVTAGLINDESKELAKLACKLKKKYGVDILEIDGVLTHIRKVNPVGVTKWCIK